MFFSPVCFLPWRAAWPEVVKVSVQLWRTAWGQGYFFFVGGVLADAEAEWPFAVAGVEALREVVIGVFGSDFIFAEMGGRVWVGVLVEFAVDGVGRIGDVLVL